ncbi:MAG: replication protein [Tenericutes bacterium]|nr:replication protein [Mycoplasmatota bacterium]
MKGRNWAFVMYPESMPANWFDILEKTGLPFAISPLHDKDVDPTGESKKPHYHVICQYTNTTTAKNVKENVCDKVNGTIPIKLESIKGMYRYHLHLDNPEKYQYDDRDRIFINGFDVSNVNALTQTEVQKIMKDLTSLIIDNEIYEYADLLNLLLQNDLNNMFVVASSHTIYFSTFINSRRNKAKAREKEKDCKRRNQD